MQNSAPSTQPQPTPGVDAKHFLASRTVWGLGLVLAPTAARLLGYQLEGEEAQQLVEALATFVGAGLALYGRIQATQRLTIADRGSRRAERTEEAGCVQARVLAWIAWIFFAVLGLLALSGCAEYVSSLSVGTPYGTISWTEPGRDGKAWISPRRHEDTKALPGFAPSSLRGQSSEGFAK